MAQMQNATGRRKAKKTPCSALVIWHFAFRGQRTLCTPQALQYNGLAIRERAGTLPRHKMGAGRLVAQGATGGASVWPVPRAIVVPVFYGVFVVSEKANVAVAEPAVEEAVKTEKKKKPKRQPRYHVILWDDDDHSYEYVIEMMQELFGYSKERGFQIAKEVDTTGRAICLTTTLEHAELKRDQIHAFGKDRYIARCKGSMRATIEAEI